MGARGFRVLLVFISAGVLFGGLVWVLFALCYTPPGGIYEGLLAGILVGSAVTVVMIAAHKRSLEQVPPSSALPRRAPRIPLAH